MQKWQRMALAAAVMLISLMVLSPLLRWFAPAVPPILGPVASAASGEDASTAQDPSPGSEPSPDPQFPVDPRIGVSEWPVNLIVGYQTAGNWNVEVAAAAKVLDWATGTVDFYVVINGQKAKIPESDVVHTDVNNVHILRGYFVDGQYIELTAEEVARFKEETSARTMKNK